MRESYQILCCQTFKDIKEETIKVFNIFKKYRGEVINLVEKDNPYPNRYAYEGDWELPEELPTLK